MHLLPCQRRGLAASCLAFALLPIVALAQTISGTVFSSAGQPLPNALVSKKSNRTVAVKTDAQGKYSISGTSGDVLLASAFLHNDRELTASGTSGVNITMTADTALNTRIYHNNFNYLKPGVYAEASSRADFFTYNISGADVGRMAVDTTQSYDGKGSSIRVLYPKGAVTPSDSGIQMTIPLSNNLQTNNFGANELYFSYWFKFSSDFEFTCGGKMPGLYGSTQGDDSQKRWSGRWMFRYGGSLQYYMHYVTRVSGQETELDWGQELGMAGPGECRDRLWTAYLQKNKWHHIELHYKLNTVGQNNGVLEGWLDGGVAYFQRTGIGDFRRAGEQNVTINAIFLSTFYGGSKAYFAPTKDVYAWFDEFTVSQTRIGYKAP